MKNIIHRLLIIAQFGLILVAPTTSAQAQSAPFKTVAYFAEWSVYGRDFHVSEITASKITHLNYAFLGIAENKIAILDRYAALEKSYSSDYGSALKGNFRQLQILKEQNPHLKVLVSVGGWNNSQHFSAMTSTKANRDVFIESVLVFLDTYKFDGLDIDWEYPVITGLQPGRPEDRANYNSLLSELRAAFGSRYLLTVAAGASVSAINAIDYAQVQQHVDWINLMAYDFHGSWEANGGQTGHHAALRDGGDPSGATLNGANAVSRLIAAGVPANKVVLGLPFYGRSFAGASGGLYSAFTGAGPGTYENGALDYKDIAENYLNKNGYAYVWDDKAQAPYLFNEQTDVFISYDDPRSVAAKSVYAREAGLGGLLAWELSTDNGSLLTAMHATQTDAPAPAPAPTPTPEPTPTPAPTPTPTPSPTPTDEPDLTPRTYDPLEAREASPDISTDKNLPGAVLNAPCTSGSLVKTNASPAVYYCGSDGKRYVFPNERVYFTWYDSFSGVVTITQQQLAAIPIGGNVNYRPGTRMVKLESDPKVYAIERGGVLRWVPTEQVAAQLYGLDWNKRIDFVPDAFWFSYTIGAPIEL